MFEYIYSILLKNRKLNFSVECIVRKIQIAKLK